jgi:hypothetical protein
MNRYEVRIPGETEEIVEHVHAGHMEIEAGVVLFRKSIASGDVIMAYKTWNKVTRVAVNVEQHS